MSEHKRYTATLYCPNCYKEGELREYFYPFFICKICLGIFKIGEVIKENEKVEVIEEEQDG